MNIKEIVVYYLTSAALFDVEKNSPVTNNHYTADDFSIEAAQTAERDVIEFVNRAGTLVTGLADATIGVDFWLTRNRHGSGFWDRGLGEAGDKLTELAHSFGEVYTYIGDDGKIHFG